MQKIWFLYIAWILFGVSVHAQDNGKGQIILGSEKLSQQDKSDKAIEFAKKKISMMETSFGTNHIEVGTVLCELANLYYMQGKYSEAESLYKRALAIREKSLDPGDPAVAYALYGLANTYYNRQGQYAAAEPLYKRVLLILENSRGSEYDSIDDMTVSTLSCLGNIYYRQGQYAAAEPLYKRALAICEKTPKAHRHDLANPEDAIRSCRVLMPRPGNN